LITSLSYTNAQKINAVLDEIGIDKVEEEWYNKFITWADCYYRLKNN
jgi:hypothetical protein